MSFIYETTFDFSTNEDFDTIKIGGEQELKYFLVDHKSQSNKNS